METPFAASLIFPHGSPNIFALKAPYSMARLPASMMSVVHDLGMSDLIDPVVETCAVVGTGLRIVELGQ